MNTNFDRVITMSLQNHGKEIFDNISTNNALYYMLKKRDNIKIKTGGRKFTHPLYYATNSSFHSYSKFEPIGTPYPDNLTRAEYDIKIIAGSLVCSTFDEATNNGDREKLIDLVEETKMDAEISMAETLGGQTFKDGTNIKDFGGLPLLINEDPDTQTDVGGISSLDYAYWRNYSYDTAVTQFNTSNAGLTAMDTCLNQATFGNQGPRAVFTTKAIFQLYHIGLTANIRYTSNELADTAFRHLAYATMPVLVDDNCPTGNMYFVDTNSLWLQVLARGNMKVTPFEYSHDQLSRIALMYLFGNLTTGSRRTSAVIDSITG